MAGVVLAGAAACGSSGPGPAASTPPTSPAPLPSASAVPTTPAPSVPLTTAPASTPPSLPSASISAPPSSPASPASSATVVPPIERSTCTSLRVLVIRGSASAGQEIAALQFTNTGPTTCRLVGYPLVTLLLHGRQISQSSQPSTDKASSRTLAPGDTAESRLHDYTTCQAPLTDSVRVQVPGSTTSVIRPAQLRACIVRVDALGPPE